MPPKIKKEVVLEVLEEKIHSDEEIEAPPPPIATPKPKRLLTEKQKETLAKGRAIAHSRREHKDLADKKQALIEQVKKETEDKLIKTAIKVKKRQLLMEEELKKLNTEQEEEIPDEVVKKIIREKHIPKPILKRQPEEIQLPAKPNPFANYYFLP